MASESRRSLFPRIQIRLPGFDAITALVILLILIHFLLYLAGGPSEVPQFYHYLGLSWHGFSQGKIWQFITHALLHANWLHLTTNLLMLWLIGGRIIHILGHRRCMQIITLGIIFGGLMHILTGYVLNYTAYPDSQLVGISGACFALLLTLTTLSPDSKMWPITLSGKNLGLGIIIAEFLLWLMQPGFALPVFSQMGDYLISWGGASLFQISHACHLGGALAGWWLARRLLALPPSLEKLKKMRLEKEASVSDPS